MSAEEFWGLRVDLGFDKYLAAVEKQNAEWQLNDEFRDAEGNRQLRRTAKLIYKENPVPKSVRSMVGDGDFMFTVQSTFWPDLCDEAHPMAFKTILPFFSDRISIEGLQWAEPVSATQCRMCARVDIKVRVTGISSQVEKAIEKGCKDAYAALPKHAEAYVALKRAALLDTPAKPSLGATPLGLPAPPPAVAMRLPAAATAAPPADAPPPSYVPPPDYTYPASPALPIPLGLGMGEGLGEGLGGGLGEGLGGGGLGGGGLRLPLGGEEREERGLQPSPRLSPRLSLSPSSNELQLLAAQARGESLQSLGAREAMHVPREREDTRAQWEEDTRREARWTQGGAEQHALLQHAPLASAPLASGAPLASLRQRTLELRSSLQEAEQQLAREEGAKLHEAETLLAAERRRSDTLEKELLEERLKVVALEMLLNQLQKHPAQLQGRRSSRDLGSGRVAGSQFHLVAGTATPPSPSGSRPQPGFTALPPPPALHRSCSAGAAGGSAGGGGSSSSPLGLPPRANTLSAPPHTYAEAAAPPPSAPPPSAPPPSAPQPSAPPLSAPQPAVMREPSEEERQRASAAQARLAARGKEEARARAVSAADEAAGAALREVLGQVGEGAYAGEGLLGHVVLGTMYLLCTELRVLLLRTGTWALLWQVPWRRIKESQLQLERGRVLLTLLPDQDSGFFAGPLSRSIECSHRAGLTLAHSTLEMTLEMHRQKRASASQGPEQPLRPG